MARLSAIVFAAGACSCLFLTAFTCPAQEFTLDELETRLTAVRQELDEAKAKAAGANKAFHQFQHDVVYTNESTKAIYAEMKQLEKQLVEKRQELSVELNNLPAMRELRHSRDAQFERVRELKEQVELLTGAIRRRRQTEAGAGTDAGDGPDR